MLRVGYLRLAAILHKQNATLQCAFGWFPATLATGCDFLEPSHSKITIVCPWRPKYMGLVFS